jgi:arylsulfatase A-like enzyme
MIRFVLPLLLLVLVQRSNGEDMDDDAQAQSRTPNLLFIMTDQQRWDAFSLAQSEMNAFANVAVKINTPNMERLAQTGAYFRKAYCHSPTCAPSRGVLKSGCTIERSGVQANKIVRGKWKKMKQFVDKIMALKTYDQLLVEERGYASEQYGKFHLPPPLYRARNSTRNVVSYTDYNFLSDTPVFTEKEPKYIYQERLSQLYLNTSTTATIQTIAATGQQIDPYTEYPYQPIPLDPAYGLTESMSRAYNEESSSSYGVSTLPASLSPTAMIGEMALRALDRLARGSKPFSLTVSFNNPHPPMIAISKYYENYSDRLSDIYVSESIDDPLDGSAYASNAGRDKGYGNSAKVQEWTAVYYAMVEEVDEYLGKLMDKLDEVGARRNTLVVFTSDHGEMLGAHAMQGKVRLVFGCCPEEA